MFFIQVDTHSGMLANPDVALKYQTNGYKVFHENGKEATTAELSKAITEMSVKVPEPTTTERGEV